jgi:hypothetical protein
MNNMDNNGIESKKLCSPQEFIANYQQAIEKPFKHGYYSISSGFRGFAKKVREDNNEPLANVLDLCACVLSMKLNPTSANEPFSAFIKLNDKRSAISDDFNEVEMNFIAHVLHEINEPMIQARFADLLWLLVTPKQVDFARTAIDAYLALHIDPFTWRADVDDCWERAIRLARQLKDYEALDQIELSLMSAFRSDYPDSQFMRLWLGELIESCGICRDDYIEIADTLFKISHDLFDSKAYRESRSYLELAATLFQKNKDEDNWLRALLLNAECYEAEGNSSSNGDVGSQMAANNFYENALQAYRRIPAKHREKLGVIDKLSSIRKKITEAGVGSLDEMQLLQSPMMDIKDLVEQSIKHVGGKETLESALLYYTGFATSSYQNLKEQSIELIKECPLSSLIGSSFMANDGRVIAKTSSINLDDDSDDNDDVLTKQIIQSYQINIQMAVQGQIIPGLNQILSEFRVSRRFVESLCKHSPIIPDDRVYLFSSALWLGFEHDFANAIHLLCPQIEHMIRIKFKEEGILTSNVDRHGIETENGLSTLLDNERAEELFGEDLLFEMKAIFTESISDNLRNNTAHGLLNDNSASSYASIYAWWMILKLVVRSLYEYEKQNKSD